MSRVLILGLMAMHLLSCKTSPGIVYTPHVIPEPNKMSVLPGRYDYDQEPSIIFSQDQGLSPDQYLLKVTTDGVTITHSSDVSKQYALATLEQLKQEDDHGRFIPIVQIDDQPRFSYRGFMLDEARHFQGKEFVKKTLDRMAFHKLNKFHWHLSDDQGWRVEIKKYPLLAEKGSVRKGTQVGWQPNYLELPTDSLEYGGFYTQEDIKEIVAYASNLGIDVIPEIDMPGHMMAALHAYPELGENKDYEVRQYWGVAHDVLDVSNPKTLQFAKDVVLELCELFPYSMIHLGGDECPKDQWKNSPSCQKMIKELGLKNEEELQSWFMKEIEKVLMENGKSMAGWDEILEGDMSETAVVYNWRFWTKEDMTVVGASRGNRVVSCLNNRNYFDHYVSVDKDRYEPLAFPAVTPLHKTYNYNPVPPELAPEFHDNVIGVQGNLWTEYVVSNEVAEIRMFPRMALLSEVAWTNQDKRDWEWMNQKLPYMFDFYEKWEAKYNRVYIATAFDK